MHCRPDDYSKANLEKAYAYLGIWDADLGGTEVLDPLKAIFAAPVPGPEWKRQIIYLAGGNIRNLSQVC